MKVGGRSNQPCTIIALLGTILRVRNSEEKMPFMKSLTLTAAPKASHDPVRNRRERLIARLMEQKELISNPSLVRTVQRTVKKDGVRTVVEVQQRVRPWWRTDEKGQVVLFVRVGWHLLEFGNYPRPCQASRSLNP
jgi:hypothetical protein